MGRYFLRSTFTSYLPGLRVSVTGEVPTKSPFTEICASARLASHQQRAAGLALAAQQRGHRLLDVFLEAARGDEDGAIDVGDDGER